MILILFRIKKNTINIIIIRRNIYEINISLYWIDIGNMLIDYPLVIAYKDGFMDTLLRTKFLN